MATIVILEHLMQKNLGQPYLVYTMAKSWVDAGHEVVVHHGPDEAPPGDVAVVNIDLTLIPPAYVDLFDRYPVVINRATTDISKRGYSTMLLDRTSDWDGRVIVKTNANYGGRLDAMLHQRAIEAGLVSDIAPGVLMKNYVVMKGLAEVPQRVWDNEHLIVEKFLPEKGKHGYCMRVWVFLGDAGRALRMHADQPIIKSHHIIEREEVVVPEEIRAWRERLGFDYGKFDYVERADGPVLIDANRTPGAPADYDTDANTQARIANLSLGLNSFLDKRRSR